MKKNIFIILVSFLFILILMYFYDKREMVLNKEYIDEENNIYIEYPYFNDSLIDKYINNYLNRIMDDYSGEYLFIDYDYDKTNTDTVSLTMYTYEKSVKIVKTKTDFFEINLLNEEISTGQVSESNEAAETNLDYDIYTQKIIDKDKPMIALTFDDGPNHNTIKILEVLERYGIKATFFILGVNIKGNEDVIKRMSDLEMEIGSHLYSHKLLTNMTDEKIISEKEEVDDMIFAITSKYPTFVRPSYGAYNKRIKSLIASPLVTWNVDTLDWKYHNSNRIYNKVMKNVSDGDIILMHDIYSATANSLGLIIPALLSDGYQFVTVSELLYYKGIEVKNGTVYSNAN